MPVAEYAQFRVSLTNGDDAQIVSVEIPSEERFPRKKLLRRHVEVARDLPDGRKRLEYPVVEVEQDMAVLLDQELRAEAVRIYNAAGNSSLSARQLKIDPFNPLTAPHLAPLPEARQAPRRKPLPDPVEN